MKSNVISLLERNTAVVARSKLGKEMKMNGDGRCLLIPSTHSLRQIVYRNGKSTSIFRDDNVVLSIAKMKMDAQFFECTEDIGIYPFFVYAY